MGTFINEHANFETFYNAIITLFRGGDRGKLEWDYA